ncbi:MAG: CBS domain-containing protein [Thermodesulfovibrionales bacterium]|nr:CBS domain-containing protein [Thermodesulfovibrionales bacterium]
MQSDKKVGQLFVAISDYPHINENGFVKDAFQILRKNFQEGKGYRRILVLDGENRLKGLLGVADLVKAAAPGFLKASKPDAFQGLQIDYPALSLIWQELFSEKCKEETKKPVKEAMQKIGATVSMDDPVAKAAYVMITANTPVLPVMDAGKVVGVIRLQDVFNEIADVILQNNG